MALCQMHADRFTVPVGWSLKILSEKQLESDKSEPAKASKPKAAKPAKATESKKPAASKPKADKPTKVDKAAKAEKPAKADKPTKSSSSDGSAKSKKAKSTGKASSSKKSKAAKPTAEKVEASQPELVESAEDDSTQKPEVNPHARETAWFVPDSFDEDAVPAEEEPSPLLGAAAEGSLLARAFNGPSAASDDESGDELPFPPHGDEVTVS